QINVVVDSSGTLGTGILKGTKYFFGDYDECLGINNTTNGNHIHIVGQYCTLQISIRDIIGNVPFKTRDELNGMNASIDSSKHLLSARLEQCVHRNDNPIQWLHIIIGQ
ncbi:unnamed protein product, partial [Oppiella nova]